MDLPDLGLLILRVVIGLVMAAHGAQKAFGWWQGPGYAAWRDMVGNMGFHPAELWAALSTAAELLAGLALALGFLTPFAAAAVLAQAIVIIGSVHWPYGFFNTENGIEYPLVLGGGALGIALTGPGAFSLDAALGIAYSDTIRILLVGLGVLGALVALAVSRSATRAAPQP